VGRSEAASRGEAGAEAGGRRCPLGIVSRIEIRNHSLFAPDQMRGRPFAWALRLANWAHVRTRADYLKHELLVSEGDCYDPEALRESLRLLREAPFIARARGTRRQLADSTWLLEVETWDEWTTQVSVNLDVEDRAQFQGAAVTEKNLLGRGMTASLRYHRFREREDRSFTLGVPRILGTRTGASVSAGTTRTGSYFGQEITHPFTGESGRVSFDSHLRYEDHEYSYMTGRAGPITHVLLPLRDRSALVRAARRFGVPGALTMLGGEIEVLRRSVSGPVRQVVGADFEGATPAPDSLAGLLGRQGTPDSYVRVGVAAGIRRIRFVTRRGLDLVSGVQDVALGSELTLTVGRTLGTWGTVPLGTYARVDGFLGGHSGPMVGRLDVSGEARRLDSAPVGTTRWRDVGLAARAAAYVQPWSSGLETLEASIDFNGRWHNDQPYQVALGGPDGIRSYRDDQVPAASVLVGRLEERVNLAWLRPAVDLGLTLFGDTGLGWADGTPFARDTGWRSSLGAGLRIGFPAGTSDVARVELAWPVGGPDAGRRPVFRIYWSEIRTGR